MIKAILHKVNLTHFIDQKSKQLTFFVRGYWDRIIPYKEIDLFFWDTMEEWTQVQLLFNEPYSQKERVFWHLLHQLHFWPEQKLMHDPYLYTELLGCIDYLDGDGSYPMDCVGIRP